MTTHEHHFVRDHRYDAIKRVVYWALLILLALMVLVFGSLASERQRQVEALKADIASQLLRAETIIDASRYATISCGLDHRILFVNRPAERLFGYRAADLIGKPVQILMPDEYHELHAAGTSRASERMHDYPGNWYRMPKEFEASGLTRDGVRFALYGQVTTIKYGVTSANPQGKIEFLANLRKMDESPKEKRAEPIPLPPVREELKEILEKAKT